MKVKKSVMPVRVLAIILAIVTIIVSSFTPVFAGTTTTHKAINLGYKGFNQQRSSDCVITSVAMLVAYHYNIAGSGTNNSKTGGAYTSPDAQAAYATVLQKNGGSISVSDVSKVGVTHIMNKTNFTQADYQTIYSYLEKGEAVMLRADSAPHNFVVYACTDGSTFSKSSFKVVMDGRYFNKSMTWQEAEKFLGATVNRVSVLSNSSIYDSAMQQYCQHTWATYDTSATCSRCHARWNLNLQPFTAKAMTLTTNCNLKNGPYSASSNVKAVGAGSKVTICNVCTNCYGNKWYYVYYKSGLKTYYGFVYSGNLK